MKFVSNLTPNIVGLYNWILITWKINENSSVLLNEMPNCKCFLYSTNIHF